MQLRRSLGSLQEQMRSVIIQADEAGFKVAPDLNSVKAIAMAFLREELSENEKENSDLFKCAVLLIASMIHGPDITKLAHFTRFGLPLTGKAVRLMRRNGIWERHRTERGCLWKMRVRWNRKYGLIAFCLDTLTVQGIINRFDDKYQKV